jgi:CheY-like chemotaxis protein
MGGEVSVVSEVGKGSTFTLIVPMQAEVEAPRRTDGPPAAADEAGVAGPTNRNGFAGHVLVVEDDPGNQKLSVRLCQRLGFEVGTADNGAEAVEKTCNEAFDIILMDIQTPVLDGLQATRIIRDRGVTTPIIALTAYAFPEDRQRCLDAGCDDYLAKPIERHSFEQMIARYAPSCAAAS